jgi:hypothetical protein
MHDADQLKILTALGHAATLLEAGAVNGADRGGRDTPITPGHPTAAQRLNRRH